MGTKTSSTHLILINHFACHEKADVLARLHLKGLSSPHRPKTVSKILPFWWWEKQVCGVFQTQACLLSAKNNKTTKFIAKQKNEIFFETAWRLPETFDNICTCQRIVIYQEAQTVSEFQYITPGLKRLTTKIFKTFLCEF